MKSFQTQKKKNGNIDNIDFQVYYKDESEASETTLKFNQYHLQYLWQKPLYSIPVLIVKLIESIISWRNV